MYSLYVARAVLEEGACSVVVNDNSKLGVHPCHCSSIYAEHASTSGSRESVMVGELGAWWVVDCENWLKHIGQRFCRFERWLTKNEDKPSMTMKQQGGHD